MIVIDLNANDAESLLRHCEQFQPASGDSREDRRLEHALQELANALRAHLQHGPDQ